MAAIIVSGVVGIGGIVGGFLQARQSRTHDERMGDAARNHEREMTREARTQERRADAYIGLLGLIDHVMQGVNLIQPDFQTSPDPTDSHPSPDPPDPPSDDEIRLAQAKVGAFGSPEVKLLLEKWTRTRAEFQGEADMLSYMQAQGPLTPSEMRSAYGATMNEQRQKVSTMRRELHAIVREIEDEVNGELR